VASFPSIGARADDSAAAEAAVPAGAASPVPEKAIAAIEQTFLLKFLAGGDNFTLIDARSPDEYAAGHIARAINVPHDAAEAFAAALPTDLAATIVVYCKTGKRASALRDDLVERGYTDVRVLGPSQIFWTSTAPVFNCGLPVEVAPESSFLPSQEVSP
jgi:rhodanese-related sulfurtransferase